MILDPDTLLFQIIFNILLILVKLRSNKAYVQWVLNLRTFRLSSIWIDLFDVIFIIYTFGLS